MERRGWGYRAMLILGCSLFTVLQPLAIWRRSKKIASAIKEDTHIMIDGKGIHVTVGAAHTDIAWDKVRRISKKPDMLVIFRYYPWICTYGSGAGRRP